MIRTFLLCSFAAAALPAQATQILLPAHADLADGHQSLSMPFGVPGFRTQILVDTATVAPNGGFLTGLRFRIDRGSAPLPATTIPNVTVSVSETQQFLGNLSPVFAANVTSISTVVFQGAVTMPAQGVGGAGPLPWDVVVQFQSAVGFSPSNGNLLFEIVGNNPPSAPPTHFLDAVEAGGSATVFGTRGDNPTFDSLQLLVSTGIDLVPSLIVVGSTIDFTSTLSFTSPPGALALSTIPLPSIDLGPIGAPTNTLYLDPLVFAPHSWTPSFIGNYSTFTAAVPSTPALIDTVVYGQSAILEPTANALGLVLSNAVEVRLGSPSDVLPMQQVDAADPNATSGAVVDFTFGFGPPSFGAVAMRLEGFF